VAAEVILTNRMGEMWRSTDHQSIDELLQELDGEDHPEHPDVSIKRPDGWAISAFANGDLVWENVDAQPASPRYLRGVSRSRVAELMRFLANGDLDSLRLEPWRAGYPWSETRPPM
jgi:hypothetical protein